MSSKIVILGGGPAGLALAMQLLRRSDLNAEIHVIEKEDTVGGLTRSFEKEGLYFDFGSHRLHPATSPEIMRDIRALLGEDLLDRPRDGRILLLKRFVKFPLNPVNLLVHLPASFVFGFVGDLLTKPFRKKQMPERTFSDVLLNGLGKTICQTFYFPYARKLWGLDPDEIAATQARKRVGANNIGKIIKKVLSLVPGFKKEGAGRFFYPKKGYGQIADALAQEVIRLGGKIHVSTKVEGIHVEDGRVVKVDLAYFPDGSEPRKESINVDFLFSTIPVPLLMWLLKPAVPADYIEQFKQLRYRDMILFYLILETDQLTKFDAHYFPEEHLIFSRLQEPKNYSASTEPKGLTGLCFEIPCSQGDTLWNRSDTSLLEEIKTTMAAIGLPIQVPIREAFSKRVSHVYPVYDLNFEKRFEGVDAYLTAIQGLVHLGRQGLFAHDNTHHTMEMAYRASDCLNADCSWNNEKWREFREQFQTHVVED